MLDYLARPKVHTSHLKRYIVEREETARWGHYRSRDLCLAWINALMAGQPDAEPAG